MTLEQERLRADGAAFCVAHRLRYDPRLHVGCVLCQRAFSPAAPHTSAMPQLLLPIALGVLVGMLSALAVELSPPLRKPPAHASAARSVAGQRLRAPARMATAAVGKQEWASARDDRVPRLPEGAPSSGLAGAAVRGDLRAIANELAQGAEIDEVDGRGHTPLLWALLAGRPDAARLLIECRANVELATPSGLTPLMLAADKGLESVTALLLAHGAKPSRQDREGLSALMLAARADHRGVVLSLLAHGAEAGQSDGMGRSALMHAAQGGASGATVDALLERGARLEARDVDGGTALLLAVEQGRERSVRALIARGALLGARDHRGFGALDRVVQPRPWASKQLRGAFEATLDLLIASGVDPRLKIDPATNDVLFRARLEALYASHQLGPLPPYQRYPVSASAARAGVTVLDSPATVQLLPQASGWDEAEAKLAQGVLVGYRGWTSVPKVLARASLRNVVLQGEQRATLVGEARGEGAWQVADVMLLELLQDGRRIDIAFAGSADGIEVDGTAVRRLGGRTRKHVPGSVDLTPWLAADGRQLVVTALSSFRGGHVSKVYLRVNGAGARRTLADAEVDRSRTGGTP
jgi:ankyrin repeat protein